MLDDPFQKYIPGAGYRYYMVFIFYCAHLMSFYYIICDTEVIYRENERLSCHHLLFVNRERKERWDMNKRSSRLKKK